MDQKISSTTTRVPVFSGKAEELEAYKRLVTTWRLVTEMCESKKGLALLYELEAHTGNRKDLLEGLDLKRLSMVDQRWAEYAVYRMGPDGKGITRAVINKDTAKSCGIDYLMEFLDEEFTKSSADTSFGKLVSFLGCGRSGGDILEFFGEYQLKLNRLLNDPLFGKCFRDEVLQATLMLWMARLNVEEMTRFWMVIRLDVEKLDLERVKKALKTVLMTSNLVRKPEKSYWINEEGEAVSEEEVYSQEWEPLDEVTDTDDSHALWVKYRPGKGRSSFPKGKAFPKGGKGKLKKGGYGKETGQTGKGPHPAMVNLAF